MKIVLDGMGGDHAPQVTVEGAVWAAQELGVEVILVGREDALRPELAKHGSNLPIVSASQAIEMADKPAAAVKSKKDSSIIVGMELLRRGQAQAFVSAGNSGAVMAAALFHLGRLEGIKRPALSMLFASQKGPILILDVGANTDCKPSYLLQFGLMGSAYMERVLGFHSPRVGIISNGEEEGKGNQLVLEAYPLLQGSGLNFVGNVEGKDVPLGLAQVVVTDGFTGNVMLKLAEGINEFLGSMIREEMKRNPLTALGGLLAKPAFARARKRLDYSEYGGAILLGVKGVVIITHGRTEAKAIKNSIGMAKEAVEGGVTEAIAQRLGAPRQGGGQDVESEG